MARFAGSLVNLGLVLLGLVLMATPLALWVAWSPTVLVVVLATSVVAGGLYCVLCRYEEPAGSARVGAADPARLERFSDTIVEELQRLHPFVNHNRLSLGPRFRAVMSRLRRQLY